ncbi:response regulator [Actinoplanes sp. NEAU-A11]|uniref:Response regulator n=1 Tax=Actinoplanes aureus TaxID=2792083 RepID=A0A931G2S1_9ACTN|nr:response regulator [Actinoplanes aureus]
MIVTVDDHDDVRALIERSLQRAGHTVITAVDGVTGLAAVRQYRPNVVITDVDMPRMNGLELCDAITHDPDLQHIPVMLVSGSIHPSDPRSDYAGAAAMLSKPFAPKRLLDAVDALLARGTDTSRVDTALGAKR